MGRSQSSVEEMLASEVKVALPRANAAALDRVVTKLREIQRTSGLDRTVAVGALIFHEFFEDDPEQWRDRRRNKNHSIRRLAEREDCPLCKSALNEAVGVYVALAAMPHVRTSGHITASHIAAALAIPPEDRQEVIDMAERNKWSVRELKQRVVELRRLGGERRGRPNASEVSRNLVALRVAVRHLAGAVDRICSNSFGASIGDVNNCNENDLEGTTSSEVTTCEISTCETTTHGISTHRYHAEVKCLRHEIGRCLSLLNTWFEEPGTLDRVTSDIFVSRHLDTTLAAHIDCDERLEARDVDAGTRVLPSRVP
jgi:hypothetical protein